MTTASATALDDPSTGATLELYRRQTRALRLWLWLWPVCLVVAAAIVFGLRSVPMGWRLALFLVAGLPLLRLTVASVRLLWSRRWLRPVERLLGAGPWGSLPVKVLTWGRAAVLEIPGIGCVRLVNRDICLRWTAELTGQAGVVGPSPSGWVALRLPDVYWPLAARVVAVESVDSVVPDPPPPTPAPTGSALDVVNAHCAGAMRRATGEAMANHVLCAVFGAALAAVALASDQDWARAAVGLGLLTLGAVQATMYVPTMRTFLRLRARLAAAPWSTFLAELDAWEPSSGYATVRGLLDMPDGRAFWYELIADYDLLVTVTTSGVIHVAGTPEVGAVLPVGVPQRPHVGYARFTAVGARR